MQALKACPICQSLQFKSFIKTKAQMHPSKQMFNFDQCEKCQLVFLNPRVAPTELMAYYTDYYLPYRGPKAWGKYEQLVAGSQQKLDTKRAKLVHKFHPLNSDVKVLDVGCGKPTFLQKCVERYACQAIGIDFSDEGWKDMAGTFKALELMVGEVATIPENTAPDVITMWHYLEHDYAPVDNLKRLRQIAKKETTLIFEVPNFASESREKYGPHWAGWHTPRHTSLFSPDNVRLLLKNSGWKAQEVLTYGTLDPYLLYWMSEMEQKGIEWDKNMEEEFFNFVIGMLRFMPKLWRQKSRSLGIMTVIAVVE